MSGARSVENVSGEVMTSEPGGRSSSSTARYSADEPELHITPPALPKSSATWRSISATFLPIRSVPAPSFEHAEDGLDLLVVVHRGGVQHPSIRHRNLPISGTSWAE